MYIANPIYDVVFKYLMEDAKIAKLFISSIIGENILELDFLPQEFTYDLDELNPDKPKRVSKTVYRLDFSAKIKTETGTKQVIIEIQKAKFPTDIMRFRRYLGEQYSKKENTQLVQIGNRARKVGIPIVSIYFLGHKLTNTNASVIAIKRKYTDLITGKEIKTKESFIESLTHDSYVIQIPELTDKRRTELEILLGVFDQNMVVDNKHHILNIKEEEFQEKYRPIIRKLQKAIEEPEIKNKMELEDGLLDELEDLDREIEVLAEENKKFKQKLDSVENEKELVKLKLDSVESEKELVKQMLDSVENEKELVKQKLDSIESENLRMKLELENLRKELIIKHK